MSSVSGSDAVVTQVQLEQYFSDFYTKIKPFLNGEVGANLDNVPVSGSNNAVKSGGIYTALSSKADSSVVPTKMSDLTNDSGFITKEVNYSTTERIVGTWINGKPLYQKTVSCGALPNKSSTVTVTNINNLQDIICLSGIAIAQNYILPLPYVVYSGSSFVDVYIDRTSGVNIIVRTGVDQSSYTQSFITLQYTKTTD